MKRQIYLFATSKHPDAISSRSLEVRFLKPQIDFTKYDYLIITSKQTVKALEQYKKEEFINIQALCVSVKTAASYENFGGKILEIGDGYGDNLVKNIKEKSKDKKWLYLRAEFIASDFVERCQNDGYDIDEEILYVSECSNEGMEVDVKENSILIFTSPSSIECFLKTHTIGLDAKVVVIGRTTAASLPDGIECKISEKTSIESCMEMAFSLQA
ncbi:uroporphyrinogen-III synthase [Sulfurimonas gotlandica GD1]|jgi:uroporphyrinogen-III synthase|uniref:Uroporphyrinogen-III synthase n=1 Tax=Sulfurimonas gotlandica (strain DSM 19862 / JCM 16533 / GD1) TaxID=929558 RepID=B6BM94_SULGG|nr:uroporphyrinogen-III synthase [Sulfurimonas gotlandica]EDZ61867.1 uroporphyrinogen-III synthase [Sulfurimonas gotlandica GD1]EHP29328.1 uroporphyrinogen-III synthase [Sulfurimonas gotlandica GD1]